MKPAGKIIAWDKVHKVVNNLLRSGLVALTKAGWLERQALESAGLGMKLCHQTPKPMVLHRMGICGMGHVAKLLSESVAKPTADAGQEDRIVEWHKEEGGHLDTVYDTGLGAVVYPQIPKGTILNSKPGDPVDQQRPISI